jgi:HptB-dependent secretion and biofilm anti anti-sigma factor
MGIERSAGSDNSALIKVNGRFDFSCHSAFREAYAGTADGTDFIVDMGDASYMDSAALGMLLLLREYAQQHGSKVTITNCIGQTREVLQIANFHRLFKIQ